MVEPEEDHQPPADPRDLAEMFLEITTYRVDLDARVFTADGLARGLQHPGIDVERDEPAQLTAVAHGIEQHPRLLRRAAAQLHERVCAGGRGDLGGTVPQDLGLGAGRVVLGQPRDLVEQVAAHRVVEPLGRQLFRRLGQTVAHIATQRGGRGIGREVVRQRERHGVPFMGVSST